MTHGGEFDALRSAYLDWLTLDDEERARGSGDVVVARETHFQVRLAESDVEAIADRDVAYGLAVDDFHAARGDYAREEET